MTIHMYTFKQISKALGAESIWHTGDKEQYSRWYLVAPHGVVTVWDNLSNDLCYIEAAEFTHSNAMNEFWDNVKHFTPSQ